MSPEPVSEKNAVAEYLLADCHGEDLAKFQENHDVTRKEMSGPIRLRFLILAATFVCLSSIYSNQIIINFTFICMTKDANDIILLDDGTTRQRFDYSPSEKSWIIQACAIGTMIAIIPINIFVSKIGPRLVFASCGVLSAVVTMLMPMAARSGIYYLMGLQLAQGAAFAANYATIGALIVDWCPLRETATFIGVLTIYNVASTIVTNPLAALMCQTIGWQWSFYAHGIAGLCVFAIWFSFYTDKPANHRLVSLHELRVIHKNKSAEHVAGGKRDVPYKAICTCIPILVVWVTIFVEITAGMLLLSFAPTYFNRILKFDIGTTSLILSSISTVQIVFRIGYSVCSDKISCASETTKMIFFHFMAFFIAGVGYAAMGVAPWRELSVALYTVFTFCLCANSGSVYKMATYVARQHAHFVISMMQFSKSIALFIGPSMVSLLVSHNEDVVGWSHVFLINGTLLMLMFFPFWYVCTDQPAEFTKTALVKSSQKENGDVVAFTKVPIENLRQ